MPLRPFPVALGIGTDIVHVNRIQNILEKALKKPDGVDAFLRRFLTPRERDVFAGEYKINESLTRNEISVISKHISGRWAAKEATIKAVTWRRLSFHDVVILRSPQRSSVFAVILNKSSTGYGPAKQQGSCDAKAGYPEPPSTEDFIEEAPSRDLDGQIARISISHDAEYATAVCLAAEQPVEGDVGGESAARETH